MRRPFIALLLGSLALACTPPLPSPQKVVDLRVLAASLEPPEVLISPCDPRLLLSLASGGSTANLDPAVLNQLLTIGSRPLIYRALVEDPAGAGRALTYRLRACANTGDRECDNTDDFVELTSGKRPAGEWELPLDGLTPQTPLLGTALLPDGNPLLLEAVVQDTSRGLGGIRVPVMLEVKASDTNEWIFAQKLMVYQCQFFPSMRENVTPRLPGLLIDTEPWPEADVKQLRGSQEIVLEPVDFSALEEPYTVPSVSLSPVSLTETWKLAWYSTTGAVGNFETGGTGFNGATARHRNTWKPDTSMTEPVDVTFVVVARDGRGGQSWLIRKARWSP